MISLKDHIGVVRFYYFGKDTKLTSRAVLVRKLHNVNNVTITAFLKEAAELVGKSFKNFGSWVPDGASENGVRDQQDSMLKQCCDLSASRC